MRKGRLLGLLCALAACFTAFGFASCGQPAGSEELEDRYFVYRLYGPASSRKVNIIGLTEHAVWMERIDIPSEVGGYPVTKLSKSAFVDAMCLSRLTLPETLETVDVGVFSRCRKLVEVHNKSPYITEDTENGGLYEYAKYVYTESGSSRITLENGGFVVYTEDTDRIVVGYEGTETELDVPYGITEIYKNAFAYRENLTSLTIPETVKYVGGAAFLECDNLEYTEKNGLKYLGNEYNPYLCAVEVENKEMTAVEIDSACEILAGRLFYDCKNLPSVEIPDGVKGIGDWAFAYCGLTSVTIPDSMTRIGEYAFYGCGSLADVYYTGSASEWEKVRIADENEGLTDEAVHFYVENEADVPTDGGKYWRYVDGVPTVWDI